MNRPFVLLVLLAALSLTSRGAFAQAALHLDLEKAFNDCAAAVAARDVGKLKASWSAHGYGTARNSTVSAKKKFPDYFFERIGAAGLSTVDFQKIKRLKTTQLDDTASVIYYGTVFKADPGPSLTAFHFVKEAGQWKFHRIGQNFISKEQAQKLLSGKDFSLLKDKDLLPSGIVPPAPPEYPVPDYVGSLQVISHGYKTTVSFNADSESVSGGSGGGMMMGGLRRGKNVIVIKAEPLSNPTDKKAARRLDVSVYAAPTLEELDGERVSVFSFKAQDLSGTVEKEFEVTDEVLAKIKALDDEED